MLEFLWGRCLEVSVIILFFLIIRPAMKHLPRIGMYLLWIAVAVRIVCPFSVQGLYQFLPERVNERVTKIEQGVKTGEFGTIFADPFDSENAAEKYGGVENAYRLQKELAQSQDRLQGQLGERDSQQDGAGAAGNTAKVQAEVQGEEPNAGESTAVSAGRSFSGQILIILWAVGFLCCMGYLVVSLYRNHTVCRSAGRVQDNIYEYDGRTSFVSGFVRPGIYVPAGLDLEEREYVLLHERIHIRRQDFRIKPLAYILFSVLWFNPLVWLAWHFMNVDMEISCDEAVLRRLGPQAKRRYSYQILRMAAGEAAAFPLGTAFTGGIIKERIYHVMGYKKPTKAVTAAVAAAVILCSCGMVSDPGQTVQKIPQEDKKETVYVEQTMPDMTLNGKQNFSGGSQQINEKGELVCFLTIYSDDLDEKTGAITKERYALAKMKDGVWEEEEIEWADVLWKQLKGTNIEAGDTHYAPDGSLYVAAAEMSCNSDEYYNTHTTQESREKDPIYCMRNILLRWDAASGKFEELKVPSEPYDGIDKDNDKDVIYNQYGFFGNGNYLVWNHNIARICNGRTGEMVKDISSLLTESTSGVLVGDSCIVITTLYQETNKPEVKVYDENGENPYTLPVDTEKQIWGQWVCEVAVQENTILLATEKGIFEAEYGEDEFTQVVSPEKDNLYYLAPDNYFPCGWLAKDGNGVYYLDLVKGTKDEVTDDKICYYAPAK